MLIKVEMKNVFNSIRQEKMLFHVGDTDRCPEDLAIVRLAYVTPTLIYFGGVDHVHYWGSAGWPTWLTCICIHYWPCHDLRILEWNLLSIGFQLNHSKCEVTYLGAQSSQLHTNAISAVCRVLYAGGWAHTAWPTAGGQWLRASAGYSLRKASDVL